MKYHLTTLLPILLGIAQCVQQSTMQESITALSEETNAACLSFIETFSYTTFLQDRTSNLQTAVEWCFDNEDPDMSYDLKIVECTIAMHTYLAYEVYLQTASVDEATRLLKYSQFCSNMTNSLQFRDDLVYIMAGDMASAYEICMIFLFDSASTISSWWWDMKDMLPYDDDVTCASLIESIEEDEEYDEVSAAGTVLALNSFVTQIKETIYDVCDAYSSYTAFSYQCSVVISEAGILLLMEDDSVEDLCTEMMELTDCETAAWNMTYTYFTSTLKSTVSGFGYYMIEDNFDDKLDDIETTLESLASATYTDDTSTSETIVFEYIPTDTEVATEETTTTDETTEETTEETTDETTDETTEDSTDETTTDDSTSTEEETTSTVDTSSLVQVKKSGAQSKLIQGKQSTDVKKLSETKSSAKGKVQSKAKTVAKTTVKEVKNDDYDYWGEDDSNSGYQIIPIQLPK